MRRDSSMIRRAAPATLAIRSTDYPPVTCAAGSVVSTRTFAWDSTNSTAGSALAFMSQGAPCS